MSQDFNLVANLDGIRGAAMHGHVVDIDAGHLESSAKKRLQLKAKDD